MFLFLKINHLCNIRAFISVLILYANDRFKIFVFLVSRFFHFLVGLHKPQVDFLFRIIILIILIFLLIQKIKILRLKRSAISTS